MEFLPKANPSPTVVAGQSALRLVADKASDRASAKGGRALNHIKARPIEIMSDAPLDDAIALTLSSCLDHFLANKPGPGQFSTAEQIHQMRVALRRLRAAVALFRRAVRSPDLSLAAERAKAIAATLGAARDLDVFENNLEAGPFAKFRDEPSFYALIDAVECHRQRAYEDTKMLLDSAQTAQFATDLRAALARRSWLSVDVHAPIPTDAPGSAKLFAASALNRLHRRVLKRTKGLATRPEHEMHLARIALKKVRYAAEFFHSLFNDPQSVRHYLRVAAKAQDELGAFNDMAVATRLLQDIGATNDANTSYASGFVRGWLGHAQESVATGAAKSEKALRNMKPFWR